MSKVWMLVVALMVVVLPAAAQWQLRVTINAALEHLH